MRERKEREGDRGRRRQGKREEIEEREREGEEYSTIREKYRTQEQIIDCLFTTHNN